MKDMQMIRKPKQPKGNHDMTIKRGMKIIATNTDYLEGVPNGTIMTVSLNRLNGAVHASVDGGDGFDWFMPAGTYEIFSISDVDPVDMTPADDAPKLWRDMTPAEKGALLLARYEGKTIEWTYEGWFEWGNALLVENALWNDDCAYRIKPEPKIQPREFFTDGNGACLFQLEGDTHRITFNLIDGKPDVASIKMEEI